MAAPKPLSQSREIAVCSWSLQDIHSPFLYALLKTTASCGGAHPQQLSQRPNPGPGHISALCASKTSSHPEFVGGHLQLLDPVWGLL